VAEDLLEHGQHVWVFDGVVGMAALAAGRDDPGQPQLGQVLAGGGDAEADPRRARVPTSELSCAISQARCSRDALPSRANVAAAERSWGCVGSVPRVRWPGAGGVGAFSMVPVCCARAGCATG